MTSPSPLLWLFVACMSLVLASPHSHAEQTFFKPGDVIALVGGEDMVAAADDGWFEMLVTRAIPEYKLKFRCLAWEGDTVFEQRRDLNYPSLDQQLDKISATVVIAQFGKMESMAGKENRSEFVTAYGKLLERLSAGGKRRIIVVGPHRFTRKPAPLPDLTGYNPAIDEYMTALKDMCQQRGYKMLPRAAAPDSETERFDEDKSNGVQAFTRDGIHLTHWGALGYWGSVALFLTYPNDNSSADTNGSREMKLQEAIRAKNRLWFNYYRPQNWAFLAGDRTNQPSSRDHLDPSKRWFPEELEKFIPLIEQKETEIHQLAAALAKP